MYTITHGNFQPESDITECTCSNSSRGTRPMGLHWVYRQRSGSIYCIRHRVTSYFLSKTELCRDSLLIVEAVPTGQHLSKQFLEETKFCPPIRASERVSYVNHGLPTVPCGIPGGIPWYILESVDHCEVHSSSTAYHS